MPQQTFPTWAGSVPAARTFVTDLLGGVPPQLCQTAAVLVSELATNAVRHAGTPEFVVEVTITPGQGRLWVGVTDTGLGLAVPRTPEVTAEHGRGLQLIATLADRWGAHRRRSTGEKTVWFELDVHDDVAHRHNGSGAAGGALRP
jgi:anti-sigma regulatory factor (Ser/Thr protein kinase)